jgi:uncharacterized protein (DUF433 family)
MPIRLTHRDRQDLEQLANRRIRPTNRQKAQALLALASGESMESVAKRLGIKKEYLAALVDRFAAAGLAGVGLGRSGRKESTQSQRRTYATIEKTRGVCGGAARISGTRIPVWQLIEARSLGATEAQLLIDYPRLQAVNLVDAWAYAEDHPVEIAAEISANEVA